MTKDFLKHILSGQKQVLKTKDVQSIRVPLYAELNVAKLWDTYRKDERLYRYLPDHVAKGRQVDRKWFFDVWNTVAPELLTPIVEHAERCRTDAVGAQA